MSVLVEARRIRKSFAGVQALDGASFELLSGEVHALVGENGAGKSTLIRIVTGAVQPDGGTLIIAGRAIDRLTPAVARSLGIAAVYQQPALFPHLTVAENIALASEAGAAWKRIDWKGRRKRAQELLDRAGLSIAPERMVSTLSMPEQQIVEIAGAIGARAKILILDEPTASLTEREVERLFQTIRSLAAEGAGILYISHRLEEISAVATRITVLRDGRTIATAAAGDIDRTALIEMMAGRSLAAGGEEVRARRAALSGEIALEVRELCSKQAGIENISFTLRRGEILGLAGLTGAGRTGLATTIFGLARADSGEIRVEGAPRRMRSPRAAIEGGIAYLPEDRQRHGIVSQMPIAANATLASLERVSRGGWIVRGRERELARRYIAELGIRTPSPEATAESLSGGNQQKLALARWLATGARVLILDEPTQGVDVGAKAELHALIAALAGQGFAIVLISSELSEILALSDRVAVMRAGRIAGMLTREGATRQSILALALGHSAIMQ